MSSRLTKVVLGGAVAGAGYYLYSAGGSPKVAEKKFEHDAARLSSKVKGELPGSTGSSLPGVGKEAKTGIKLSAEEAGAKFDSIASQAKAEANKVDKQLNAYATDASKKFDETKRTVSADLNKAVNEFDRTVEKKAAETKGWLGGWFGGK